MNQYAFQHKWVNFSKKNKSKQAFIVWSKKNSINKENVSGNKSTLKSSSKFNRGNVMWKSQGEFWNLNKLVRFNRETLSSSVSQSGVRRKCGLALPIKSIITSLWRI